MRRAILLAYVVLVWLYNPALAKAGHAEQIHQANPVIAGDHPDPSIIRVGKTYWMTSTSGDWSPQFPLFRSEDLQHWQRVGAVFPQQPSWASSSFWAPELAYDRDRVLVYYVARKRNGPLCVAAASASAPEGPYTDAGPLVCQADGSIDPAFSRDENGKPYLIWKEDGNSESKPTPLWAQPLTEDGIHLIGEKRALFQNEPSSWEGGVVEAPYVLRHAGKFYMFYAGNACCGNECNYAEGVARADHLLGPWEKNPDNPIIRPNGTWKCPGHGSAVATAKGQEFFLYHAYPRSGTIFLGREAVLDAIHWNSTGWPVINDGHGPSEQAANSVSRSIVDDFQQSVTSTGWRWPVNHPVLTSEFNHTLKVEVASSGDDSFLAQSSLSADYLAQVKVDGDGDALGSLGVFGNAHHVVALGRSKNALVLWKYTEDRSKAHQILWQAQADSSKGILLRVSALSGGKKLAFSYSSDGQYWKDAGAAIDVSALPQWDQGLAVGLLVSGKPNSSARFEHFELQAK